MPNHGVQQNSGSECQVCTVFNHPAATQCEMCTSPLPAVSVANPPPTAPAVPGGACRVCGFRNRPARGACEMCGSLLEGARPAPTAPATAPAYLAECATTFLSPPPALNPKSYGSCNVCGSRLYLRELDGQPWCDYCDFPGLTCSLDAESPREVPLVDEEEEANEGIITPPGGSTGRCEACGADVCVDIASARIYCPRCLGKYLRPAAQPASQPKLTPRGSGFLAAPPDESDPAMVSLREKNASLVQQNAQLTAHDAALTKQNTALMQRSAALEAQVASMAREMAAMQERLRKLEAPSPTGSEGFELV